MINEDGKVVSFVVEVLAAGETEFVKNGLRFSTSEEADAYARDLLWRWTLAREYRITTDETEPPNYAWSDGKLVKLLG